MSRHVPAGDCQEVKRASDSRIRREVVGQILEYAAVGLPRWSIAQLRTEALARVAEQPISETELLLDALDVDQNPDAFWADVERNLKAGRVRMIVVADDFPPSLERFIEFLNEQMRPAEILGVEVMQYRADDHLVYVPRAVGVTARAQEAKPRTSSRWTREQFEEVLTHRSDAERRFVSALIDDVDAHHGTLRWGVGATAGVGGWYPIDSKSTAAWAIYLNAAPGQVSFVLWTPSLRRELGHHRMAEVSDRLSNLAVFHDKLELSRASDWDRKPSVKVELLMADPAGLSSVLSAMAGIRAAR